MIPAIARAAAFLAACACGLASAAANLPQAEALVLQRANEFRTGQGAGRVAPNAALERAARGFADYMARTDQYGHAADGRQPADRASASGYDYCLVSENIAYQYSSEEVSTAEVARLSFEGWKNSPGHRRNMLDPDATDTGVAIARSSRTGRYYAVQMFGRPRDRSIEFRVANLARSTVRYAIGKESFSLAPREERKHTLCVAEDVVFPGAENAEGRKIRPSNGERLRVEGEKRLTIRRDG